MTGGWSCRECGKPNGGAMVFCGFCGIRAVALEPATETSPDPWSCRECGGANPTGTAYCGHCGARWGATRSEDLRMVTALFADISGFTTLADTLEVEELHDIIHPLIAGLAQIAERYEGFISKYAGDALLVLFGAPVAHEDDAQRALLAALEMHAALPALLAQIGPKAADLTIHVGVNTGRVVAGRVGSEHQADYSVLGDSVILAQRLESVCPSGQTYVGASTHELCAEEFDFEPVGELQLKGKLKPVEGFRLIGRRRPGTSVTRPLVGREAELAVLNEALADAVASRSVVVTVCGEPGHGKSRLLAEARLHATGRGIRWLPARCLSYGATLPYWPFADLLRQALGLHIEDPPEMTVARLAQALPEHTLSGAHRLLGLPVAEVGAEQARREVHDALAEWLAVLSDSSPVVLSVEDTHWADQASMDVLGELARTMSERPVAFVLTARPEGAAALQALAADACHRHLEVRSLDTGAVTALAADVLEEPVTEALGELLGARTLGNPLFVEELARSLREAGALVSTTGGLDLRPAFDLESVPATVERVFAARVDRLPPPAAEVLQLCSVIGRTTRLSLLQAVAADPALPTALNLLLQEGFLDSVVDSDEPAVTFHHALLNDVAYGRLLRKNRRAMHRRVADVGRVLYGDSDLTVDLLARHLYLAEAGEEAVDPLLRAGRRAARLFANDAAALHLERAVEVLDQLDRESARLDAARLELAQVQERRGVYDEAQRLYELRRQSDGDPRAWRGLMSVQRSHGEYDDALQTFVEASRRLDPRDPSSGGVWVEAGWTLGLVGRASDAVSVLLTALRLLGQQDPVLRAELLCQLVDAERSLGMLEKSINHAQEAVGLADPAVAPGTRVMALRTLSVALLAAGRADEVTAPLHEALALSERIGALDEAAGCLLNLGFVALESGDVARAADAVHYAREAILRFEKLNHRSGRAVGYCNLADALRLDGRLDEALLWCEQAGTYAVSIGHGLAQADALRTRARIELTRGNPAAALDIAQQSAAAFIEHEAVQEAQVAWDLAVQAARAVGDQRAVDAAERAAASLLAQR